MNQFIKVNNKILNKNNITQVVMDPDYTVEDGFLCSEITIFYVQEKEVLEERIEISIEAVIDDCPKIEGTPCYELDDNEELPVSLCDGCKYTKNVNKMARKICRKKLSEQFDVIAGALGVDDIPEINCNGYISLNEEGKLCWKER